MGRRVVFEQLEVRGLARGRADGFGRQPSVCRFLTMVGMSCGSPAGGRSWKLNVSTPNTTPLTAVTAAGRCTAKSSGPPASVMRTSRRLGFMKVLPPAC